MKAKWWAVNCAMTCGEQNGQQAREQQGFQSPTHIYVTGRSYCWGAQEAWHALQGEVEEPDTRACVATHSSSRLMSTMPMSFVIYISLPALIISQPGSWMVSERRRRWVSGYSAKCTMMPGHTRSKHGQCQVVAAVAVKTYLQRLARPVKLNRGCQPAAELAQFRVELGSFY